MKIVYDPRFITSMRRILEYIALDSRNRSQQFRNDVKTNIETLKQMPYKHRKSIHFEDDQIRDMVFKGYTIVYKIDKSEEKITVFGIRKYKEFF